MEKMQRHVLDDGHFGGISLKEFRWVNEPNEWKIENEKLHVVTDEKTDFWQKTYYDFHFHSGHVYGMNIKDDFTFQTCVKADFAKLYDQAGLMIMVDEKHWLKTGIEYNDGEPMIASVLTNEVSDWSTGIFHGNPKNFWIRLTKLKDVVCVKYSSDNKKWILLRLCPFPKSDNYFIGLMCCTPQRKGLAVTFSDIKITKPSDDILHSN